MSSKPKFRRRVWLINYGLQLKLIGYAMFSVVIAIMYTSMIQRLTQSAVDLDGHLPGRMLATIVIGGGIIFSLVATLGFYLTNQIAGPLFRLERELKKIADTQKPEIIYPRRGDACQDLVHAYNEAVRTLKLVNENEDR